jgi:RNA polymerase sigma-70 factor (ECF subfamily)
VLHTAPVETEASPLSQTRCRETAWRQFYAQHFTMVYRLVARSGVPLSEVEDVTQRVFVVAARRHGDLSALEHPKAWLRAVVLRLVRENRRKRQVREWKTRLFGGERDDTPACDPERLTEAAEAQAVVGRILDRMPWKLREVLVLTDIEQCKPQEVARTLGIPVNTVRSRRRLAREEFKKRWRRLGLEGADHG